MAKREKRPIIPVDGDGAPLGVSIGALLGKEPSETTGESRASTPTPEPAKEEGLPKRAVLTRETKGRGGKTVTAVSFRDGKTDLEILAKELRAALGCGGAVEGERIILQGDQVIRTAEWLASRGVKAVRGN